MQQITSQQNDRLKVTRRLQRSKGRRQRQDLDRILLEGPHLVTTALQRDVELEFVLFAESRRDHFGDLRAHLERAAIPTAWLADEWLAEAADADSPRGVVAVARLADLRLDDSAAELTAPRTLLYLDRLQDPGNVGALIRSALGAGCNTILASRGTCDWRHPRALRASAGAALGCRLFWGIDPTSEANRRLLQALPHQWIGLSARGGIEAWAAQWPDQAVLVVGSEAHGLQTAVSTMVDQERTIPLSGGVESLNAAVAGALMLFARAAAETA